MSYSYTSIHDVYRIHQYKQWNLEYQTDIAGATKRKKKKTTENNSNIVVEDSLLQIA